MSDHTMPERATYPQFGGGGTVQFVEKPVPQPGAGQLLLRCKANALCGSELGMYQSGSDVTADHEAAGPVVHDTVRQYTFHPAGSETGEIWQAGYFNDVDRQFHKIFDKHFDALLAAFRDGAEPPVHARAGRRALELACAAIESYETGRRVAT